METVSGPCQIVRNKTDDTYMITVGDARKTASQFRLMRAGREPKVYYASRKEGSQEQAQGEEIDPGGVIVDGQNQTAQSLSISRLGSDLQRPISRSVCRMCAVGRPRSVLELSKIPFLSSSLFEVMTLYCLKSLYQENTQQHGFLAVEALTELTQMN